MKLEGAVALVTGANRGLGREFTEQLLARGAAKVYAAARDSTTIATPGVEPLELDLLDPASIQRAAQIAGDVTLLINNAGISLHRTLLSDDLADVRREMDTIFFGTLEVTRAFAGTLGRHGGGGVLNVLSALSWFSWAGETSYSAAKAAEWSLTNATRVELAAQHTQVTGLLLGAADTDMMAGYEGPLLAPADVIRAALDGIERGEAEVLVDGWSRTVKAALAGDPTALYDRVAAMTAG